MTAADAPGTRRTVLALLASEALAFLLASLAHRGWLVAGYEHGAAALAEAVIGLVLLAGCGVAWALPPAARAAAIPVQAFALLGTLVGVFTILVGVGPQTLPDKLFHLVLVPALAAGLWLLWTGRRVTDAKPLSRPGEGQG